MDVDVKKSINIVVLGPAESGKSTTVGHLVYELGALDQQTIENFERESSRESKDSTKFIWILDKLKKEKHRGTTDLPYCSFETTKYCFNVIETSGHNDFIKNMVTGASQADCALVIISAKKREFEDDITSEGVIREHLLMANLVGIQQLIVCVNKMDTVKTSHCKYRFEEIKKKVSSYVDLVGFNSERVAFVPINSWNGDNLFQNCPSMDWHENWVVRRGEEITHGVTLIEALNNVKPPNIPIDKPLRIPLTKIYQVQGTGTVFAGHVKTGILRSKADVTFAPSNKTGKVTSIKKNNNFLVEAFPGDLVGFKVKDVSDRDIYCGDVCGESINDPPRRVTEFKAHVFIIDHPGKIKAGFSPVVECHTANVSCQFRELLEKVDMSTSLITEVNPLQLKSGDSAIIDIVPLSPISVESFEDYASLGCFAINNLEKTEAVGIIKSVKKIGDDSRDALELACSHFREITSLDKVVSLIEKVDDSAEDAKGWPVIRSRDLVGLTNTFVMAFNNQIKTSKKKIQVLVQAKEIYTNLLVLAENARCLLDDFLAKIDFDELLHAHDIQLLTKQIDRMKGVIFTYRELLIMMKLLPGYLLQDHFDGEVNIPYEAVEQRIDSIVNVVKELWIMKGQENIHDFMRGKGFRSYLVAEIIKMILDMEAFMIGGEVNFED